MKKQIPYFFKVPGLSGIEEPRRKLHSQPAFNRKRAAIVATSIRSTDDFQAGNRGCVARSILGSYALSKSTPPWRRITWPAPASTDAWLRLSHSKNCLGPLKRPQTTTPATRRVRVAKVLFEELTSCLLEPQGDFSISVKSPLIHYRVSFLFNEMNCLARLFSKCRNTAKALKPECQQKTSSPSTPKGASPDAEKANGEVGEGRPMPLPGWVPVDRGDFQRPAAVKGCKKSGRRLHPRDGAKPDALRAEGDRTSRTGATCSGVVVATPT